MSKDPLEWGSAKPEVVRSAPLTEAQLETFIEKRQKQNKEIIDLLQLKASLAV